MSTHNICFHLRYKKDISIFWMKKAPYLLLWCVCFLGFFVLHHEQYFKKINKNPRRIWQFGQVQTYTYNLLFVC